MSSYHLGSFHPAEDLSDYISENLQYPVIKDEWAHSMADEDTEALETVKSSVREVHPKDCIPDFRDERRSELINDRKTFLTMIEKELSHRDFPPRDDWEVAPNVVEDVTGFNTFRTIRSSDIAGGFESWNQLYEEYSDEELAFISDAVRVGLTPSMHSGHESGPYTSDTHADIVDGLRYYKDESSVGIPDIIRLTKRGGGESFDVVEEYAEQVFDRLHPVIGAHLAARTPEIKTNKSNNSRFVKSSYSDSTARYEVNVNTESGRWRDDRCTTALVFGWSLVNLFEVAAKTPDNEGTPRSEWGRYFDPVEDAVETYAHENRSREENPRWAALHDRLAHIDDAFRDGEFDPVQDRQMKNGKDLLAYGFELWVANPDKSQAEQEPLYEFFMEYLQEGRVVTEHP